jgi:hypothetical protein
MAFYPPPDEVLPIFNPVNFQTQANTGTEDIPFLTQYFLRFPTSQGSEVVAGSLTSQQQLTANTNIVMDGTANTNYLEFPDGTQQFTASQGGNSGDALLSSANTWTNTNTFSAISYATTPTATANGTQIPTTDWVNTAITTAIASITPTKPTSVVWEFDRDTDATFTLVFPTGVFSYTIVVQAPGGNAGLGIASDFGGDTYFRLGGMGGGGSGFGGSNIPNNSAEADGGNYWDEDGQTWTGSFTASTGVLALNSTSGNTVNTNAGGNGADTTGSAYSPTGGGGGSAGAYGSYTWTSVNASGTYTFNGTAGFSGANGAFGPLIDLTTTTGLTPPYSNVYPPVPADLNTSLYTDGANGSTTSTALNDNNYVIGGIGCGQFYAPFGSTSTLISGTSYYGFYGAPKGKGQITLNFSYNLSGQVGGTNASFIAYDDPDPATKTKQIYTDKEGLVVSQDLTGSYKTTTLTPTNLTQDLNGVVSTALIADIIAVANAGPVASDLDAVLTAGNTATNSIALNNTGTGANVISLLPNVGATDPQITITDGTTTNTINKSGYTTRNSVQNSTHYLNFSDNSATGTGAIQKTAGLSCNPSTNTLSATTLTTTNLTVNSPYNFSVISIFADATARDTALPSPYAGQFAFLTGSNNLQFWNTNWTNVSVLLNNPVISGFTITTQYELIYVNASNTVINAPTLGGFTIVRFFPTTTTSGTITLPNTVSVEYLVVAGGGGGGGGGFLIANGGGGGAGGLLTATDTMVEQVSYAVSVGQGGTAGAITGSGGNGANSSLVVSSGTITAIGGGGGGSGVAGLSGGSGGGAGYSGSVLAGGTGTALQGNDGGSSTTSSPYPYSGGGGGAGAVGSSSVGQGGVGLSSTITGATVFYAGGGGGGASAGAPAPTTFPTGGNGGGGNGGYFTSNPTAGTNGRGGGGGGRGNTSSIAGTTGGSGVVLVRFPSYT